MVDPILGAAVYFNPSSARVAAEWLDGSLALLARSGAPVRVFGTDGVSGLESDVLHPYPPYAERLRSALQSKPCMHLELHALAKELEAILQPQGTAQFSGEFGVAFIGLPPGAGLRPGELLQEVYRLARVTVRARYGIAYFRSNLFGPAQYAKGILGKSTTLPFEDDPLARERIRKWLQHKLQGNAYPQDGFRSVYPAQLVSDVHRTARVDTGQTVADLGLGTWTPADDGLWLWELTDDEVTEAKAILDRSGLLLAA